MNTLIAILKKIWQILALILYYSLSVLVFCLVKLKDLLEPNRKKQTLPKSVNKEEAFRLNDYSKQKNIEEATVKNTSPIDNSPIENIIIEDSADAEIPLQTFQYEFPTLNLLTDYPLENIENIAQEIENKKQLIKQTLGDFGIDITNITATVGATITLYELFLDRGVSANKIKTIDEDIARALCVQAVRIISPFKDRGTVALEVPNKRSQIVGLKSILETAEFQNCNFELPLALGKTIDNKPQIIDLAEMPHILVAGATGQGKSVGLNAMITSLLYKKCPEELKLVLIDPKLAELSIYEGISYQFSPSIHGDRNILITDDTDEIADTLQSLCVEMRKRLSFFRESRCRNIKEYNADKQMDNHTYLPYIVVVIDEFADIMKNKAIKEAIILLARQARAAGIHLVVATQRPSATAISGDITANFPARIAFKVIKRQNSDIILGESGAEKLIGKGDMLFCFNSEVERLQGAFINTEEVRNVVEFIEK